MFAILFHSSEQPQERRMSMPILYMRKAVLRDIKLLSQESWLPGSSQPLCPSKPAVLCQIPWAVPHFFKMLPPFLGTLIDYPGGLCDSLPVPLPHTLLLLLKFFFDGTFHHFHYIPSYLESEITSD
jgi:hypothetical protein